MAASGSDLDDKRWNFEQEIRDVFNASLKCSFPELKEEAVIYDSQLGMPGDFNCQNVLTIWPILRKSPELREMYPHIKTPRDIGEVIKKNLPTYVSDMMDEEPSVEDVGFVTLSLSREWLTKAVYGFDGIEMLSYVALWDLRFILVLAFDLGEMGNTFVYLLHRRAEIHRITNQSRKDIDELKNASNLIWEKYEGWEEGEERMLEFHLLEFTEVLEESCLSVLPHMMCKYLYDLSKKFESYNDSVRTGEGGSHAETSKFLLCEATALVMEKCFHLLGITPENSISAQPLLLRLQSSVRPPMAEREKKVEATLESEFVHRFITPCFVSAVRDPCRKSRFEVFTIRPFITTDSMFEKGNMFGLISVSDKYGLRSHGGAHLFEPDFPYVPLFNVEWCDPINIHHAEVVYLENPSSHLSVPFSSSIEIRMELYVTTEKKDGCFQLCNRKFKMDLKDIWGEKLYSKCGRLNVKGKDGRILMHYILLKDAVDTALQVTFKGKRHRKVYGNIFAYYGGEFSYDCLHSTQDYYMALLCRSYLKIGQIPLKKSMLAVPKNASLKIKAHLVDVDANEVILSGCYEFLRPTEGITYGILDGFDGTTCSLELKVDWKY
ncbi:arginine--tRNA ligase, chloroplastic/mitochondrial [Artemisia annua]|uniref:arginine--tRNA ligase n=1 Tax=Artemisia annua TaxID=35608 RepID=A0A2U1MEL4_ARTAN|nr:arginine--tRNA ligase, chloroplastic/mitochondrial [Artemisia annua]